MPFAILTMLRGVPSRLESHPLTKRRPCEQKSALGRLALDGQAPSLPPTAVEPTRCLSFHHQTARWRRIVAVLQESRVDVLHVPAQLCLGVVFAPYSAFKSIFPSHQVPMLADNRSGKNVASNSNLVEFVFERVMGTLTLWSTRIYRLRNTNALPNPNT